MHISYAFHISKIPIYFDWKKSFCSKKSLVLWIKNFISSTGSSLEINELLNFQKPGPLLYFKLFMEEQKTVEWSVQNAFKMSTLEIISWILFEMNIKSNLWSITPEIRICQVSYQFLTWSMYINFSFSFGWTN